MGCGDVAQCGLGLDRNEVPVVIDRVNRLRGVSDLPDDDGCDLNGVAMGIVDLEMVGFEVPDPHAYVVARCQWHHPGEAWSPDGTHVATEELNYPGLTGLHDHQRAEYNHYHHYRQK